MCRPQKNTATDPLQASWFSLFPFGDESPNVTLAAVGQRLVFVIPLIGNLQSLLDRAKSGTYRASPVRRVHILKGGSGTETRPLGIPTLEDKILQRAVVMLLEPIYEQDFLNCSFGFRPGRSADQALQSFRDQLMNCRGGWVLEVDILKFIDNLDHGHPQRPLGAHYPPRLSHTKRSLSAAWQETHVMETTSRNRSFAGPTD